MKVVEGGEERLVSTVRAWTSSSITISVELIEVRKLKYSVKVNVRHDTMVHKTP